MTRLALARTTAFAALQAPTALRRHVKASRALSHARALREQRPPRRAIQARIVRKRAAATTTNIAHVTLTRRGVKVLELTALDALVSYQAPTLGQHERSARVLVQLRVVTRLAVGGLVRTPRAERVAFFAIQIRIFKYKGCAIYNVCNFDLKNFIQWCNLTSIDGGIFF
jgi:hypothetical protein